MRDSYGLDDTENDGSFDKISRREMPMGFLGADVEIGEVSSARFQRIGKA
jgi:hypothetical protein